LHEGTWRFRRRDYAVAVAVVSWVTHSISTLAAYGWGLPVLVAMGIVLAVVMGLSFAALPAAKAWRAYHPLLPMNPIQLSETTTEIAAKITDDQPFSGDRPWRAEIDGLGSALEGYVDAVRGDLKKDIVRLNELGVAQHQVSEAFRTQFKELQNAVKALEERLVTHERVVASGTHLLIRALRARDAMREIIIPNDKTAMSLGKRLAEAKATDYPDPASWLADFQRWNEAAHAIDRLMMEWTRKPSYEPVSLFDLEGRHFQNSPMPPENIRTDDTIFPFKTVWYVQSSYANQRDGAFSFFNERMVYPDAASAADYDGIRSLIASISIDIAIMAMQQESGKSVDT